MRVPDSWTSRRNCFASPCLYILALIVLVAVFSVPPHLSARTWSVYEDGSGDAPTIQAALDSVSSGDSIHVYPGSYYEAPVKIDLGKLALIGVGGSDVTTISFDGSHSTLFADSIYIGGLSFVEGTTFRTCATLIEVEHCSFRDFSNIQSDYGCIQIGSNIASPPSEVYVTGNRFENNESGGRVVEVGNSFVIRSNWFVGNASHSDWPSEDDPYSATLLLWGYSQEGVIEENIFIANEADVFSGLSMLDENPPYGSVEVRNNIFYQNGGKHIINAACCFGMFALESNIFLENTPELCHVSFRLDNPRPRCNVVWPDFLNCDGWFSSGSWNFHYDPRFCGAEFEDFAVQTESICLPENQPEGATCGLIGIFGVGCPTVTRQATWGQIKIRYGKSHRGTSW